MPARPQKAAGPRIDPPVSRPVPPSTSPAATAAPVPLEEPPVKRLKSHGLRAGGQGRSNEGPPRANSWVASLPTTIAPASRSRLDREGVFLRHMVLHDLGMAGRGDAGGLVNVL